MEMQRQVNFFFDGRYQIIGIERRHDAAHVFDANGIRAHLFQCFGFPDIIVQIVNVTAQTDICQRIANRSLKNLAVCLDSFRAGFHIAEIVKRIKTAENINADFTGLIHESAHDVIGVMAVTDQILPADQHGKRRFLNILF